MDLFILLFQSVELTHVYTKLHEDYADYILQRMRIAVTEGTPVNPPIWWLDPDDEEALKISDGEIWCFCAEYEYEW